MERYVIFRHSYLDMQINIVPLAYIQRFYQKMCVYMYLKIQLHELQVKELGQLTNTNTYSYMFFAPCIVM